MMTEEFRMEFPRDFPIKAMGRGGTTFDAVVVEIVRRHAPDLDPAQVRAQDSRNGNYRAVTVVVRATSRAQLDAIYLALSSHEAVVMAL